MQLVTLSEVDDWNHLPSTDRLRLPKNFVSIGRQVNDARINVKTYYLYRTSTPVAWASRALAACLTAVLRRLHANLTIVLPHLQVIRTNDGDLT